MRDRLFYQHLRSQIEAPMKAFERGVEETLTLFKHVPLSEDLKQTLLANRLKSKSAWYACLVNSNIDELLIPEYLESKQSRNILIKKETDQFYKSLSEFDQIKPKQMVDLYNRILYNEDIKSNTFGLDLFSSQVVNTAECPDALINVFELWDEQFEGFDFYERLVFELSEWFQAADNGFSNQRQCVLWLNYCLWQHHGQLYPLINLEQALHQTSSEFSSNPQKSLQQLFVNLQNDLLGLQADLIELYRKQFQYDRLKKREQTLVNYLIEQRFDLNAMNLSKYASFELVLNAVKQKGFIALKDVEADWLSVSPQLEMMLADGVLELGSEWDGKVNLYLNTSLFNATKRLYKYQNVTIKLSAGQLNQFEQQTVSTPIVPIESAAVVFKPTTEQGPSRPKAFFG